ncbi:MAG: lytic murein transglycosylase [Pseudomonadota bacterium]
MIRRLVALSACLLPTLAQADERPVARPELVTVVPQTAPAALTAATLSTSNRPVLRPGAPALTATAGSPELSAWLDGFRGRALAQGISAETFTTAMRNVTYLPDVIRRDRNQSEFTKTIWDYLNTAVSDLRVRNGRAALARHSEVFDAVEARYGVEREIVAAVWGLESSYGTFRGSVPVLSALATLAADGRRGAFFEGQLVAALQIIQSGDISSDAMTGSWAGAMGHTQFIPTSYLDYAQDLTGDGRRDIWSNDPSDALASTANYLAQFGWQTGQPWGVEVQLPDGFDYALASERIKKTPAEWTALGIRRADGGPLPEAGPAAIRVPAGHEGAAFATFANFEVIERYNTADAYVIGVGHLADRLAGGPAIQSGWPEQDRALTFDERVEMQRRLAAKGFDPQKFDGRIGPLTLQAIRGYQASEGLVADGYASPRLLSRLQW